MSAKNKYDILKKDFILFLAQHCAKKSMVSPRKYEPPQKRNSYFYYFSGQTLCQKESMGSKKKDEFQEKHHICSGQTLCQKKKGSKKNMILKKKGIRTFFGPDIAPKKVRKPKIQYDFGKKELN